MSNSNKILSDKDFFKKMKREVCDFSDNIAESFPYFCLKIFWDNLSQDSIEEAIGNLKTNDESIDAFFIDEENKEINIIQCKSCISIERKRAIKKADLSYLNEINNKLTDNKFINNHKNNRIKDIAKEYILAINKGYKVKKYFFALGRADKNILDYYGDNLIFIGFNQIKDEYQEYISKLDRTEPDKIKIQINFDCIEPEINQKHKTLISVITGDEIIKLRKTHRYKLFDKNLRFGLGKNKINGGILKTVLSDEIKNFYYLNNGITITSKGFKLNASKNTLTIDYPQIINGAQTVNAIYEGYKKKHEQLSRKYADAKIADENTEIYFKDLKIIFRVIQDSGKDGKKTTDFEENVIRCNNTQNPIKETDFYANNKEQITLQQKFAKYGYFYEIKRGDRKYLEEHKAEHTLLRKKKGDFKFWEQKIILEKFASIWMAYRLDPTLNKVSKENIFGQAGDKNYDALFNKDDEFPDCEIQEMILAINLFEVITSQAEIYSNKEKKGKIVYKLTKAKNSSDLNVIKKILSTSCLVREQIMQAFENENSFFDNNNEREYIITNIKKI